MRRSGMVIKTVYETVKVFQTNNNNNCFFIMFMLFNSWFRLE